MTEDNRFPNPIMNVVYESIPENPDKMNKAVNKVKVILAYELEENPECYRKVAEQIVATYNDQHAIRVFGEGNNPASNYEQYVSDGEVVTGLEEVK